GVRPEIIAASAVLAGTTLAQRSFVVDAANGPGTNFTDLPQALAQAQHGDVYIVRPGFYSPCSTDKGVSLLGLGATISGSTAPALVVQNLPAGRTFAMRAFAVNTVGATSAIALHSNAGKVILEEAAIGNGVGISIDISNCRLVAISHATLSGTTVTADSTLV